MHTPSHFIEPFQSFFPRVHPDGAKRSHPVLGPFTPLTPSRGVAALASCYESPGGRPAGPNLPIVCLDRVLRSSFLYFLAYFWNRHVIEEGEPFTTCQQTYRFSEGNRHLPSPHRPVRSSELDGGRRQVTPIPFTCRFRCQLTLSLRHSLSRAYGIRVVTLCSNLKGEKFCVSGFAGALSFCGARVKNNGSPFTPLE